MPEISEERLSYLEAVEAIMREVVGPLSRHGYIDAMLAQKGRFAREWSDEQVEHAMRGSALWDDRPKGWRRSKLLIYSRGELRGRAIIGGNLDQTFWKFVEAALDPITFWREWRL